MAHKHPFEVDSDSQEESLQRDRARRRKKYSEQEDEEEKGVEDDDVVGVIEKVTLKNFMCHSNLEFVFSPHVNFVIGKNGSGKSAVLSGIILALGAKSSVTGRNTNIKEFIQTGKESAIISVTLRNTGIDAYRPSDYGTRIIVEREIKNDGCSKYKLKGAGGKLISSKLEELHNILDALNIQIGNPVAVLTQDASRNFLASKDPKKKYSFFCKATQLEKLSEQYEESKRAINDAEERLNTKRETLPESEREVKKWEDKLRNMDSLSEQEERIKALENELSWAIAIKAENREKELFELKEKCAKAFEKAKADEAESKKRYSKKLDRKRICSHNKKKCESEIITLTGQINEIADRSAAIYKKYKEFQNDVKHYDLLLSRHDAEVQHLKKVIEESKMKQQKDIEEAQKTHQENMDKLQSEREKLQLQLHDIDENISALKHEIGNLETDNQSKEQEIKAYKFKIANKSKELIIMKSSHSGKAALYDPKMPQLLKMIQSCSQFHVKPFGPLGMYINVPNQKWTFAVEQCLINYLKSFCCDNEHDRTVLVKIMRSIFGNQMFPSIVVSQFLPHIHDVRGHKVVCADYQTVLDSINCDNSAVMNCLIDQLHIESILLIENSTNAANLMMDCPPKNCLSAYTLLGDQLYPDPKYRYYSCKRKPCVRFLRDCYTEADICAKEREVMSLHCNVGVIQNEKDMLVSAIKEKQFLHSNLEHKRSNVSRSLHQNAQDVEELKRTILPTNDISSQESDLQNQEVWRDKMNREVEFSKKRCKEKDAEYTALKAEYDRKDILLNAKKDDVNKLLSDLQDCETELAVQLEKERHLADVVVSDEQRLEDAKDIWQEAKDTAFNCKEGAISICPRIDTQRKQSSIACEIKELKKIINEQSEEMDREVITKNYVDKKGNLEIVKREIRHYENMIQKMNKLIKLRLNKFKEMRTDITLKVQYMFQQNMKARRYTGQMKFDHDKCTLDIEANPKQTKSGSVYKTSTLSGGERSYVTVSFLLALFDATELPFHILDEYDVFMDATNKNRSMEIMMEMANSQKRNQFIFLSPLELPSSVKDNVKIHKMPDPEHSP